MLYDKNQLFSILKGGVKIPLYPLISFVNGKKTYKKCLKVIFLTLCLKFQVVSNKNQLFFIVNRMKLPHIHLLILTELKKNVYKLKLEIKIEIILNYN